ncbi:MAG: LysR family transcriptional regulator [Paracoccaceae bacterium]|nr:LysR family transcriptional regulator [Paracoccaceae bacterium]MDG2257411.1 LysR family transcriptional regulator [Paracoccaceae bacterium]
MLGTDNIPELPHIRYLFVVREVFRLRRIGAAADVVHLSQPAATQALSRIEALLGVTLFDRRPSGMYPTDAGNFFESRLQRILDHLQLGDRQARRKAGRKEGSGANKSFHSFCTPVQLRALLAIAKSGNFSQAANDLGVKQPGIHRASRDLSALAGFALFEQTRGGVVLTAAAEVFAHQVRLAASEFRQAIYEINELMGRDVTTVNVGSMPLSRTEILPAAIDMLLKTVGGNVQVHCVDARYDALLKDLRFGDLDFLLGALRYPLPANDVVQEELFVDKLALVVSPQHPLAKRERIELQETLEFPWIAPPKSSPSGAYLFETLRIQDLPNTPVRAVSSSLVLLRGLLARGNYISIASARQVEVDEQMGALVRLPINLPESGRAIGFTFRKGWRATPIQEEFLNIIRRGTLAGTN